MTPEAHALLERSRAQKREEAEKRQAKGKAALAAKQAKDRSVRRAEGADARVELFAFNRHAPAEVAPRGEPGMDTIAKDVPLEWVEGAKAASEVASILAETRATKEPADRGLFHFMKGL